MLRVGIVIERSVEQRVVEREQPALAVRQPLSAGKGDRAIAVEQAEMHVHSAVLPRVDGDPPSGPQREDGHLLVVWQRRARDRCHPRCLRLGAWQEEQRPPCYRRLDSEPCPSLRWWQRWLKGCSKQPPGVKRREEWSWGSRKLEAGSVRM